MAYPFQRIATRMRRGSGLLEGGGVVGGRRFVSRDEFRAGWRPLAQLLDSFDLSAIPSAREGGSETTAFEASRRYRPERPQGRFPM